LPVRAARAARPTASRWDNPGHGRDLDLDRDLAGGRVSSRWSIASERSLLSIASRGSVLSIGSVGSCLSIGSIGSVSSVLAVGSASSAASVMSAASCGSVMSAASLGSLMSASSRGGVLQEEAREPDATARAVVGGTVIGVLVLLTVRWLLAGRQVD
jgi:hypothetical protein